MRFELDEYQGFVKKLMDSGYRTISFADPGARDTSAPNLLLRHDIDMDPAAALPMAEAENAIGARSTYYVLLSNRHTNPFDTEFRASVRRLAELGHWIGLHFDATQYGLTHDSPGFNEHVGMECELLSRLCGVDVDSVSFHRPARDLLSSPGSLTHPLPHTYEHVFLKEIEYCSDSAGRWAYGPPTTREAISKLRPFHFLTHPISWGSDGSTPSERVAAWIIRRAGDDFVYELPDAPNPFGDLG